MSESTRTDELLAMILSTLQAMQKDIAAIADFSDEMKQVKRNQEHMLRQSAETFRRDR